MSLHKLKTLLDDHNLDALFVSSVPNITYLTGFSGFGTLDRDAFLLITKKDQYIFTHGIYKEVAEKEIRDFELIPISRENPISDLLKKIIDKYQIRKLGFEAYDLTVEEYKKLLSYVPEPFLKPSYLVHYLRKNKTPAEIAKIKKACELGDKTFMAIIKNIKSGITEKQLAGEIDLYIKKLGAEVSFPTTVAFGSNASRPHHIPSDKVIEKNAVVLMDFGVKLHQYCSDMTRSVFFGKASEEHKKIYLAVLKSQQIASSTLSSFLRKQESKDPHNQSDVYTIKVSELDKSARDYIISKGYPPYPHSLGHGIGLEVHEVPRLSPNSQEILEDNMVFSIEPGVYLPDNIGVRIEDLFAIENKKLIQLTNAPKNLIEIL